jgi:hypothetical protein
MDRWQTLIAMSEPPWDKTLQLREPLVLAPIISEAMLG